jgi:predicted ATPase
LQGWEWTRAGQGAAGIAQIRQGLAALRATGAEIFRPSLLALLAEACGSAGQIAAGLNALQEALAAAEQHTEHFYIADLHRLRGELLLRQCVGRGAKATPRDLRQGHAANRRTTAESSLQLEAEACFQRALRIARRQEAKSLELRAALRLGRLWWQHGKGAAARQLLGEVYGWFSEGFDTADLREAQALLQELA